MDVFSMFKDSVCFEGFQAALKDKSTSNPYRFGTLDYNAWQRGFESALDLPLDPEFDRKVVNYEY